MSNGQDEFVTIRPRQVALTRRDEAAGPGTRISIGMLLVGAGTVLLIAVALWVFLYLPGHVERAPVAVAPQPRRRLRRHRPSPSRKRRPPSTGAAPYEAMQIDRERKRAQETLANFVKLQIKLDETMHVRDWALDAFNAAQELANEGDALFTAQKFDEAMAHYEKGIVALETLRDQGDARFNDAIAAATHAIDQRDAAAAEAACVIAASVYPEDARIAESRSRAQKLPHIIELFDAADRAVERNDWRTALAQYRAIQAEDPKTQGLQGPLNDAQSRVANLDYQGLLTTGYAALDSADYAAAKRAFENALRQRPSDVAARDGLSQVEQRSTLSSIEQFHQKAIRAEAEERWPDAVKDYQQVLAVDASIKFAMDGRARAGARAEVDQKLVGGARRSRSAVVGATFAETVSLYQDAVKIADPGPRLTDQLNRLELIIAGASEPVPVVLTSDAATDVTISQLGALGKFSRREVQLRPGRYILIGSRDGHRDVRRELDVTPSMGPVEISCREAI